MALVVAIALAAGITYFVYRRLSANAARPQMVEIVAAAKALPAGIGLLPTDVQLIQWPAKVPLTGSFSKVQDVVGHPLMYPMGAGEPIMARDLAEPGSGIGLSVKIPPGMRAVSVPSNEIVGVAGFLFPGSHVDVLATFTLPGNPQPLTETILQDVQVLTEGQRIEPDPQGKPQVVNVVTLLLNPQDSQKLLLASEHGTIQFVLRNGNDSKKAKVEPTTLNELVSAARPVSRVRYHSRRRYVRPAPPPKPKVYVIEVIQGKSRSEEKFPAGTSRGGNLSNP